MYWCWYCHSICIYACNPPTGTLADSVVSEQEPEQEPEPELELESKLESACGWWRNRAFAHFTVMFMGHQLIDYAWPEWTMPEMCKCSNAQMQRIRCQSAAFSCRCLCHPLVCLSLFLHFPLSVSVLVFGERGMGHGARVIKHALHLTLIYRQLRIGVNYGNY